MKRVELLTSRVGHQRMASRDVDASCWHDQVFFVRYFYLGPSGIGSLPWILLVRSIHY